MSMQDPIADLFTRIRNAGQAGHESVIIPHSTFKEAIVKVLVSEGYLLSYSTADLGNNKQCLNVNLKYHNDKPVIASIKRVSKPGCRIHHSKADMPRVMNGLGILIVSNSNGVMSDRQARKLGLGGEIIGQVA